jgi:glutathione synthase/RimK-type ligase-like ATP-grasp enzyme
VILLVGIPSEVPLRMVRERLDAADAPYVMLNQRHFMQCRISLEMDRGEIGGLLSIHDRTYPLDAFSAVYTRMMDDRSLPEVRTEPPDSPVRRRCRSFHDALLRWMEITPAAVVNRCGPMGSNCSKPYQAQLIRDQGFLVPETLITTMPERVHEFRSRHGRVIYKSISATRSIVHTLEEHDLTRIESIRWCPTQFQAYVDGTNIRVHVIGDRIYPSAVSTEATDYRYAARQVGEPASLREVILAEDLAERCVRLTRSLGLAFAGIDLKITPDDRVYCFEVNPCPAFSYYEANTGQPISQGVAAYLSEARLGRQISVSPAGDQDLQIPDSRA